MDNRLLRDFSPPAASITLSDALDSVKRCQWSDFAHILGMGGSNLSQQRHKKGEHVKGADVFPHRAQERPGRFPGLAGRRVTRQTVKLQPTNAVRKVAVVPPPPVTLSHIHANCQSGVKAQR